MYREDGLEGGHIVMLGPGNTDAAKSALAEYPGGMQVGGGITDENAQSFLEAGASHVIVTSFVFRDGRIDWDRLAALEAATGRDRLVLDLSCRKRTPAADPGGEGREGGVEGWRPAAEYVVVTDRWQRFTDYVVRCGRLDVPPFFPFASLPPPSPSLTRVFGLVVFRVALQPRLTA